MRELMLQLHNPEPRARVFGFKEIYSPFVRDSTATGEVLDQGVGFLRTLFPKARFVFHVRRNLSRAVDSDFWKRDWRAADGSVLPQMPDRSVRLERITNAATRYQQYAREHPDHAFATTLEGLTDPTDAAGEVSNLFRFLDEPLTAKLKKVARSHEPLYDWVEVSHTRLVTIRAPNGTVLGVERRKFPGKRPEKKKKKAKGALKSRKHPKAVEGRRLGRGHAQVTRSATHSCKSQPSLAFDVGFNDGTDTALMLSHAHRVVALEADPALVAKGKRRFKGAIASGQLTIVEGMLNPDEQPGDATPTGNLTFYINKHSSAWSSLRPGVGCRDAAMKYDGVPRPENCKQVEYRPVQCSKVIAEYGAPFLMKLDVEGSEWPCVRALEPLRSSCRPRYLIIEEGPKLDLALLFRLGYDSFKWVRQGGHSGVWGDSSGPFGEFGWDCETGYRWRSAHNVSALVGLLYEGKPFFRNLLDTTRREREAGPPVSEARAREVRARCAGWADLHARQRSARAWQGELF